MLTCAHSDDSSKVHCSAGVGRTGTFIVIDHVMDAIKQGNRVDLVELINHIREDRMTMVQHTVQYKYVHTMGGRVGNKRI